MDHLLNGLAADRTSSRRTGIGTRAPQTRLFAIVPAVLVLTACSSGTPAADPPPEAAAPGAPAASGATGGGGPATAAELEREVRRLADAFGGSAGIYAVDLMSGREVAVAADELYPTASMIKVPLLAGLFEGVEQGRLELDQTLVYHDSLHYESGGDLINKLRPGSEVTPRQLAVQMIGLSDNTASLWIQGLVGGDRVNQWLAENGFEHTRVNSRVEGRRGDWERYGWGQSTPREMARLLIMIRNGEAVSPAASRSMHELLSRSYWPEGAASVLPARVRVASKYGAVSAARSEALLVHAPEGDYVLVVMTRDQEDTRWTNDNEGYELIRSVTRLVHDAFGHS